ncbi:MAG: hypothetical protein ACXWDN_00660 [Limisphaerales bacterium]
MGDEEPVNRQLGLAMIAFVQQMTACHETKDEVMRRHHTENYRQAVKEAAENGFEVSLCWHTLGVWMEMGKERIGCFARALELLEQESEREPANNPLAHWSRDNMRASCYYEIGRVHAAEGAAEVALDFLKRALPYSQKADEWQTKGKLAVHSETAKILTLQIELQEKL